MVGHGPAVLAADAGRVGCFIFFSSRLSYLAANAGRVGCFIFFSSCLSYLTFLMPQHRQTKQNLLFSYLTLDWVLK